MWKLIGPEINKHSRFSGYQSAGRTNLFIQPADDWFLSERHSARDFDPLPVHPSVLVAQQSWVVGADFLRLLGSLCHDLEDREPQYIQQVLGAAIPFGFCTAEPAGKLSLFKFMIGQRVSARAVWCSRALPSVPYR
jgi:hypothetical protein